MAANGYSRANGYAETDSPALGEHARPSKRMRKNLRDFGEVTPTLYRGAQPTKEGFRMLAHMGINIVIDLRGSRKSERKIVTGLGMQYVPMGWECSFPRDKTFARFLTLVRENPDKKIFVHCRVGDDRTSMMIASYRIAEQGWSAEKAKREMEQYGFSFLHRHVICPRLSSYERKFPRRFKTSPAFRGLRDRSQNH
ncbi:MAG: fused DSP-PTPase phosphatase/NAD kinase-like protein [Candidatus Acidiferrales bacterium]